MKWLSWALYFSALIIGLWKMGYVGAVVVPLAMLSGVIGAYEEYGRRRHE